MNERGGGGEADTEALLTRRQAETEGNVGLARAARNRDILPGIRRRRDGSIIRSIPGVVRQSPSLGATGTAASRS